MLKPLLIASNLARKICTLLMFLMFLIINLLMVLHGNKATLIHKKHFYLLKIAWPKALHYCLCDKGIQLYGLIVSF